MTACPRLFVPSHDLRLTSHDLPSLSWVPAGDRGSQSTLEEFLLAGRIEDGQFRDLDFALVLALVQDLSFQLDLQPERLVERYLVEILAGELDREEIAFLGPEDHRLGPLQIAFADLAQLGALLAENTAFHCFGRRQVHGERHRQRDDPQYNFEYNFAFHARPPSSKRHYEIANAHPAREGFHGSAIDTGDHLAFREFATVKRQSAG